MARLLVIIKNIEFLLPGFLLSSCFALLITELGEGCSFLDKELGVGEARI